MLKKIRNFLVGWVGSFLIQVIGPTLRIEVTDESGMLADPTAAPPTIFAIWHNRMFLMPYLYGRYMPGRRATCLVSASQDGEMIARILKIFGIGAVRGSSSRRAKEAYRELVETLKRGSDIAITPDGPRGPCYQAHVGVVGLAQLSRSPLIPVSYELEWKIELPSWDRFIIPLPFSRCKLRLGKSIASAKSDGEDSLELTRLELEQKLCALNNSTISRA